MHKKSSHTINTIVQISNLVYYSSYTQYNSFLYQENNVLRYRLFSNESMSKYHNIMKCGIGIHAVINYHLLGKLTI